MATLKVPFEIEKDTLGIVHDERCGLEGVLPKLLREACTAYPVLSDYLHRAPLDEIGIPQYFPKLTRAQSNLDKRNLVYPIKDGIFVHIYPSEHGDRDTYVPIEPHMTVDLDDVLPEIEIKLLDWVEEIGAAETEDEKREALLDAIDQSVSTTGESGKIPLTQRQYEAVRYLQVRDKVGFGLLAPLLLDDKIEDISCSGVGNIFVEHKIFKSVQAAISFSTEEELDEFVIWLGEWTKHPVTVRNPIVDAVLPDGSRVNIVYGTDVSKRGSNFTIRKFSGVPTSVMELVEFGTLDYMMAAYLSLALEEGLNLFVVGATASGKTTTMNAITTFIPSDKKIVSIEDTPELQVPHKNWIRETTRGSSKENSGAEVGMFDLLKAALRQRPDRIIIGEIRGEEGAIAFQAMQTGHGVISTFHAASVEKLIQRLTGDPINIPKAYVDNLDLVLIQAAVKIPGKGMVRRVLSINEIVSYDSVSESFSYIEAFRWNPAMDTFEFPSFMNSYVLEEKIAVKRGLPSFKRKQIYTDLKHRARIFERLHTDRHVRDFYDVFQIIAEAHRQKLL